MRISSASVRLQRAGDGVALDHFGHLGTDHMRAQQFAGLGVEHGLHHALRLAHGDRLAVADERESPDLHFVAGFLGARLGQPHRGHLRPAIGAARDVAHVHRMHVVQAGDLLHADHAFMHRLVRQPGRAGEVADRIHARLAGAAVFVDRDMRAVDLHPGAFQADVLHIADDADGGDHPVHGDVLRFAAGLDGDGDVVAALLRPLHRDAGHDLHALLLERLVGEGGDFLVLDRQDARQHFDHRHRGAHVEVEAGELDADRAGADHQQRFRKSLGNHRVAIGPDQLAVGLDARKLPRARAGRQDDVRRLQRGDRLAVLLHRQRLLARQLAVAVEHRDLVLAHQMRDARRKLLRHRARPLHHLVEFEVRLDGGEAEVRQMVQQVIDLGRAQQRLGRDAAPVQADAAEVLALHHRGLHAELRCADGGDIAAGSAAEHDEVEGLISHHSLPSASAARASPRKLPHVPVLHFRRAEAS